MSIKKISSVLMVSLILITGCSKQEEQVNTTTTTTDTTQSDTYSADATKIDLSTSTTIDKGGEYVLSGTLADGSITINTTESVHLFLENANITSSSSSPINIESADKVTITLMKDSTNSLNDNRKATNEASGAALYSRDDLVINGTGILNVKSTYNNGIESNDDLVINSGNIKVEATNNAIKGQNTLTINDGSINITSSDDGLKADNEEEGSIIINGGTININSSDDAINALNNVEINGGNITINAKGKGIKVDSTLTIKDGTIDIKESKEGFEAYTILVDGGSIKINSSDDGINIADSSVSSSNNPHSAAIDGSLTINNGSIYINCSGDGLDSNGSIYMNGGSVLVDGPTNDGNGGMDYDGEFKITGGSLIVLGSSGMAQATSTTSTQYAILENLSTQVSANSSITIEDESGKVIMEFKNAKTMNSILVSSPDIAKETYKIKVNNSEVSSVSVSSIVTSNGMNNMQQPGMR